MDKDKLQRIPHKDPVSGGDLIITELACEDSGVTIRGRFEVPNYSRLDPDQARFLETFLRCRGMLSSMEREMGMSYPTLRSRLDGLLETLGLTPVKDDAGRREKLQEKKAKILDQLEKGEITADEAKEKLRGGAVK
ncbi:MAG TPA: DUF2089 domain-containing protein [Fimbriimonadaceae bacterium]|nr:DUF2089 domain-containing protein [Fimbriimonadaceae bacterium]